MKNGLILILILCLLMFIIPFFAVTDNNSITYSNPTDDNSSDNNDNKPIKVPDYFIVLNKDTTKTQKLNEKEYLYGAIACEMPPTFNKEAIKAQAVAAYTYSYRQRIQQLDKPLEDLNGAHFSIEPSKNLGYITKDQMKSRWNDKFNEYYKIIKDCVDEVYGNIITYDGEPIVAVYHSISAGETETAFNYWGNDVSYLKSAGSFDDENAPDYQTNLTISKDELISKATKTYPDINFPDDEIINDIIKTDVGTVTSINIGDKTITGIEFRNFLSLRSANFNITAENDDIIISVIGYGHGVGMSQYGAHFMAEKGSKWQDILKHYYTDVNISNLSEIKEVFNQNNDDNNSLI